MRAENRCPTCGADLPEPDQECPFCAEARKLVLQLASEEPVRLCSRCGALLRDEEEGPVCETCLQHKPHRAIWRQEDRITRWIYDRLEKPPSSEKKGLCPHCNWPITSVDIFCAHCGQKVTAPEQAVEGPSMTWDSSEATIPTVSPSVEVPRLEGRPVEEPPPSLDASLEEETSIDEVKESTVRDAIGSFFREAFRPNRPAIDEGPKPTFKERTLDFLRSLFRPTGSSQRLLWMLLFLIIGLLGMGYFWLWLLRSGGIVLR